MTKFNAFYGLDVHQDTISVARILPGAAATYLGTIPNDREEIKKLFTKEKEIFGLLQSCYEAGSCGFIVHRELMEMGVDNQVVAPSQLPKRKRKKKNDIEDAKALAEFLMNRQVTPIYIPSTEDETVREKTRQREAFKKELKRAKNRLLGFLRRHGLRYTDSKCKWTKSYLAWLGKLRFSSPELQKIFIDYLLLIDEWEQKVKQLDADIKEIKNAWCRKPVVEASMCLKGVEWLTATSIVAEIGDFSRFPTAGDFMGFLGFLPSEYSSGKKVSLGHISKEGNGRARRLLVEAAQAYRKIPRMGIALARRSKGQPKAFVQHAYRAQQRLYKKYWRLINKGKHPNVALIAVARELAGFLWAIATDAELLLKQSPLKQTA